MDELRLGGFDEDDGGNDGHSCYLPMDAVLDRRVVCVQNGFVFVAEVFPN